MNVVIGNPAGEGHLDAGPSTVTDGECDPIDR